MTNVSAPPSFNPYATYAGFPSSYLASTPANPNLSPQAPANQNLDIAEIGIKSLLVGKLASNTAIRNLEFRTIQQKEVTTSGIMGNTLLKAGRTGAMVGGAVSLGRNIYHMAKGEINVARAGGNVAADIVGGTVGGMAAGVGASFAAKALAGSSGFALGTVGLIAGTVGFALVDSIYHATGLRDKLSDGVTGILDRFFDKQETPGGV